jgi:hypothetical protein
MAAIQVLGGGTGNHGGIIGAQAQGGEQYPPALLLAG